MKRLVAIILLIGISFYVVHDFVFHYTDPCSHQTLHNANNSSQLDAACQIHAEIHHHFFIINDTAITFPQIQKDLPTFVPKITSQYCASSIFHPPTHLDS